MPIAKKEGGTSGGNTRTDVRGQNGNRPAFRTDTAISNSRFGNERTLQPWVPDAGDGVDGSLEANSSSGPWDQFAANERLFGLKTDYDENMYTTAINKAHPQFRERMAAAERKAKEIERSAPVTAHVAEERVMDYVGSGGTGEENEEDKYSGVRRQDFPSLSGANNRYTPPAKRAPTGLSSVKGAPVDPAIISSQLKAPAKKQQTSSEQSRLQGSSDSARNGVATRTETPKPSHPKADGKRADGKFPTPPSELRTAESKSVDKVAIAGPASASSSRNTSVQPKDKTPSATSTVERDVLKDFKSFASQQRMNAEKVRSKARADKEVKLTELKKFANNFKLTTPVPTDLVSIIAKDPAKQKEIQAKAMKNAEEMKKTKAEAAVKELSQPKEISAAKPAEAHPASGATDGRPSRAPAAPPASGPAGSGNRHAGSRQQYPQQSYHAQQYRNARGGHQHTPQQQTGNLAQRLRQVEFQRFSQPPVPSQHGIGHEMRAPPTGPSGNLDSGFTRRLGGAPGHLGAKLNPNSHEFRPSPFAAAFNPNNHVGVGSSPHASAINNIADSPAPIPHKTSGQLIRRKTKAVDAKKCSILSHIKTVNPPQGRNWDDNGGLRPSFDTLPTWRQLQDDEKADSTMHLTYKEHFERQPFNNSSVTELNPPHAAPQHPHQHQLPFHLQHGAHNMGPRQSPHLPPMQMHTQPHGPVPHTPFGADDHRMIHSSSAQSFASPRIGQVPVAYPAQVSYHQPVFMSHNNAQMGPYRSFSHNPHYMAPQQGQMGGPMMMQPQFLQGPQGMIAAPQMMYHAGHPQFMPPSGPPQPGSSGTGYSPGRPAAPLMVHQGSQQGQQMYGMSPSVQYTQPYSLGQPSGPSQ